MLYEGREDERTRDTCLCDHANARGGARTHIVNIVALYIYIYPSRIQRQQEEEEMDGISNVIPHRRGASIVHTDRRTQQAETREGKEISKKNKNKKTKKKESEETKTIIVYFCCALTREWHTIHQATSLLSNYILTTLTAALMDVDLLLFSSRRREEMRGVRVSTSFSHPHGGGFKIHIAQASSEVR